MKFLFDFFPVILFFVAYKVADIFVATGVAIAATIAQIAGCSLRGRKVSGMQWASLVIIVFFGGATLLLRDETFIKWKPTVLYWLAGVVFLGGLAFRQNLVKAVMDEGGLELPEHVWTKLCRRLGRVLPLQGHAQPLGRVQLPHRDLGQLQALRRHRADGRLHPRAGVVALEVHPRGNAQGAERRGRRVVAMGQEVSLHPVEIAIRERLASLNPLTLDLRDESAQHAGHAGARPSGGSHWQLTIVSEAFRGKSPVARHRMVYEALGDLMKHDIHALRIEAFAPE